ncbi:pumilio homolog 1-like isoform X1 [Panicum virgatum]|uniref:PUM-HD domain-containing protein n=1 Tax=Panicum virgatum TaxID=38727 RepID=A0A8T0Q743_PANVG|nr:pumilio homolog 1-like isoform X1 [Panicum virgatum]KAG2570711.1 hypothetical protein PVAP13_7KG024400 [Panicum virgatum]
MAPFGDGGGDGEAERAWDPLRSGSAPPTMEGAAAAAAAAVAADSMFGGGGGGASFFSGMDGLGFGARLDEVSRRRGAAGAQEHFGNSASLSVGPPGLLLNGTGDLVERQFRKSRVHNGGALANYSTFDMGSLGTDMDPDNAEYRRNVHNRFMSNIQKMNVNRDLNASYMSDSDLSDALSGLKLYNNRVIDEWNHGDELLDELLQRQRDFCTKIGDDNRTPLVGNVFRSPRSDLCPPPIYGDGILRRQTSALDGSNVSRMSRHHLNDVDQLSLAEQLSMMRSGNLPRGVNLSRNTAMSNMINPMNNRYNNISIRDLDYVRNRRAFLEDLLAQEYLQDDNLLYNDSRIHHDEPRFPCARMQRSGSHFHPNPRNIQSHGDRQPRLFSFNRKANGRNMGSQFYHDNTLANYLDVPLDNADRSGADSVDLIDVMGHVKEVSMDQYGSRFIQQKLENASPDDREKIFPEILSNAIALTTDVFGNYVIQKFFEFATESQLIQLADQLKGHILQLSLQMYGCRVVQKVLEVVDMDRKINIVHELKNSVLKCIGDQNGNHVIQKCIECVPEDRIPFVIEPILSQILVLCTHQYGCRVIQRVLEHCHDPATQSAIMNEIVQQTFHLTDDKFGNYVVQHVLDHGKPEERSSIIQKLSGQVVILSKQKFASNVIEKCLANGTPEERDSIIGEIISSGQTFQELMKDQFGNYVVQRVLQTCDDKYLEMILSSIKLHLSELKNYTYGKHIVARVEKLIVTGEKRARMVSQSSQQQQSLICTAVDAL